MSKFLMINLLISTFPHPLFCFSGQMWQMWGTSGLLPPPRRREADKHQTHSSQARPGLGEAFWRGQIWAKQLAELPQLLRHGPAPPLHSRHCLSSLKLHIISKWLREPFHVFYEAPLVTFLLSSMAPFLHSLLKIFSEFCYANPSIFILQIWEILWTGFYIKLSVFCLKSPSLLKSLCFWEGRRMEDNSKTLKRNIEEINTVC